MLNIVVCDDNDVTLYYIAKRIKSESEKIDIPTHIKCYVSANDLLENLLFSSDPCVFFLDIDMPERDGIELAKDILKSSPRAIIVFISNMERYVFRSFEAKPFRFIRKSCFEDEISETFSSIALEINRTLPDSIVIETSKSNFYIEPSKIYYIECCNKTLNIFTENACIPITYKLSDMEKKLENYGFIRTHKGYLVNYNYIFSINRSDILLDNKKLIPVSKYRLEEVKQKFRRLTQ